MKFIISVCFLLLLTMAGMGAAPKDIIQDISTQALDSVDAAKGKATREKIESYIDFETLAKDSLGKQWGKLKPAQRHEFTVLLRELIGRTVYPKAPDFFKNAQQDFKDEKETGNKAYVKSIVRHKEKKAQVEYWFEKRGSDTWKVVDLAIEEERWVNNLKDQFSDIIREKSYAELLKRMKKRLADLRSKREY